MAGLLASGEGPLLAETRESIRLEFETIYQQMANSAHFYHGYAQNRELEEQLRQPDLDPDIRLELERDFAWHLIRVGEVDRATAFIDEVYARVGENQLAPAWHRLRGLAYLRKAEVENCIENHNRDCCRFPLAGGGLHEVDRPAQEARRSYLKYLEHDPNDAEVQWVLNILSMALNDFPQAVDPAYRIAPERLQSDHDIGYFENIAPGLGMDTRDISGGSVADDFTGNGLFDIVSSSVYFGHPLVFLRNTGDGRFELATEEAGLDVQLGGLNVVHADFNNDGHLDLFVPRGAWFRGQGRVRNSLLRNRGDGTFEDVTRAAGLAEPAAPTQVAVWFDYNNNGLLDLFVGNEDFSHVDPEQRFPSNLFRNNGDGTFTDVAEEAGLTVDAFVKGAAAGDINNNGYLDLYVSVLFGPNRLFRNNGDGTFTDITDEAGVAEPSGASYMLGGASGDDVQPGASFPCAFLDYNNNGWLDLIVADYSASHADILRFYRGEPHNAVLPRLYRNNGDGTFTDVAEEMGINGAYRVMGMGFGDLDNDGWLDVYLTTGTPDFLALLPNAMLRNDRGQRFQDVTISGGFGHLQKGHGVSFADFNNNGHQDIHHQQGGAYPGDIFQNAFYRNPGHPGQFLYLMLEGSQSNRFGVGARIAVTVNNGDGPREIHRVVGLDSSFGSNPISRMEIGIGENATIERVEVWWPASDVRTVYRGMTPNTCYRVIEADPRLHPVALTPFEYEVQRAR